MTATATAQIAGRSFQIERTDTAIFLHGTRGAVYFLREFTGEDTGARAVVSFKSGAALRNKFGEEVRVAVLGGEVEEITARKLFA